jgi:Tol biopolymer transport system component
VTIPSWSPDGKYLAYQAGEGEPSHAAIAIRTVATGEVRRLPGLYARDPRWSQDGRRLITAARDRRGRNGIFEIDVQTGATSPVVIGPGFSASPQWSPDGTKIFYKKGLGAQFNGQNAIVERDLKSGVERDVFAAARIGIYELAPDGRHLAVREQRTGGANVLVVPLDGSQPREILPAVPGGLHTIAWTRDGAAVLVLKRPAGASAEFWLVPIGGGQGRKLETGGDGWTSSHFESGFSLSPDGTRLAVLAGKRSAEVWALENFLPVAVKTSRK